MTAPSEDQLLAQILRRLLVEGAGDVYLTASGQLIVDPGLALALDEKEAQLIEGLLVAVD